MGRRHPRLIRVPGTKGLTFLQTTPEIDEAKRLITEMIRQAVRDYLNFAFSEVQQEIEIHTAAGEFLFTDDYWVNWGGRQCRIHEFVEIISLDLDWLRDGVANRWEELREEYLNARNPIRTTRSKA